MANPVAPLAPISAHWHNIAAPIRLIAVTNTTSLDNYVAGPDGNGGPQYGDAVEVSVATYTHGSSFPQIPLPTTGPAAIASTGLIASTATPTASTRPATTVRPEFTDRPPNETRNFITFRGTGWSGAYNPGALRVSEADPYQPDGHKYEQL